TGLSKITISDTAKWHAGYGKLSARTSCCGASPSEEDLSDHRRTLIWLNGRSTRLRRRSSLSFVHLCGRISYGVGLIHGMACLWMSRPRKDTKTFTRSYPFRCLLAA